MKLTGHEYRVIHASEASPGSLGYKLEEDGIASWFTTKRTRYERARDQPLPNTKFRVDATETQEIDTEQLVKLGANNPQIAELAIKWNKDRKKSGRYVVYRIEDKFKLADEIKKDAVILEKFKDDKNFRIITAAVVIYDHQDLLTVNRELKADAAEIAKLANTGASIELKDSSDSKVKLSNGTVVGYEFARACWELKTGNLEAVSVDAPGEDGKSCPGSSVPSYKNAVKG